MSEQYNLLLNRIHHGVDPYAGFPASQWAGTWYNDAGAARTIFKEAIDRVKPAIIVEVGSFVGESAIFMAKHMKSVGIQGAILCIDTWYGGIDHWEKRPQDLKMWFGRPSLYYQFMGNVMAAGLNDTIVPLALDSANGARLLKLLGIQPNMVYVDASHEKGDALRDFMAYWEILAPGGLLMTDDLTGWFPGVVHDWTEFIALNKLTPDGTEGEKAYVIKR